MRTPLLFALIGTSLLAQQKDSSVRYPGFVYASVYGYTNAGLQAAIDATPAGGTVFVSGAYAFSGTGDQLILINKSINIKCAGWGLTNFIVNASVGASTDIIRVRGQNVGTTIKDCQISAASGTPGRHGIHLDATSTVNGDNYISNFQVMHNLIGTLGGQGIQMTLNAPNTDGVFTGAIKYNNVTGIDGENSGDGISIEENIIQGANGIHLNSVSGAYQNTIEKNRLVGCKSIWVEHAWYPQVVANQLELGASCAANDAGINITGTALRPVLNPHIQGNQIFLLGTSGIYNIKIDYTVEASIDDNTCGIVTSNYRCIRRTGNQIGTIYGVNHVGDLPQLVFMYSGTDGAGDIKMDQTGLNNVAGQANVGSIKTNPLSAPVAPTVTATCVSMCSQAWTYGIAALDYAGYTTQLSATTTVMNRSTLDGSNYNDLVITGVTNAAGYYVYRTVAGPAVGTGLMEIVYFYPGFPISYQDAGQFAVGGTSAPKVNRTGSFNGSLTYNAASGTLEVAAGTGGSNLKLHRVSGGTGTTPWGLAIDNTDGTDNVLMGCSGSGGGIQPWMPASECFLSSPGAMYFGTGSGSTATFGWLSPTDVRLPSLTTGAATGKKVLCWDSSTGRLYPSSTGTDCSN